MSDLDFGLRQSWARTLLDGWQLSGIYTYATGPHATPTIFVSGAPFAGAAFNTTLNGLGGSTRVPFLPRSYLDVGTMSWLDLRLSKSLAAVERWRLMVLFEAFNVTNSQYDTAVRTQAYQASGGVLRPTPRLGEGTQSAGFPDGTNARRAQIGLRLSF